MIRLSRSLPARTSLLAAAAAALALTGAGALSATATTDTDTGWTLQPEAIDGTTLPTNITALAGTTLTGDLLDVAPVQVVAGDTVVELESARYSNELLGEQVITLRYATVAADEARIEHPDDPAINKYVFEAEFTGEATAATAPDIYRGGLFPESEQVWIPAEYDTADAAHPYVDGLLASWNTLEQYQDTDPYVQDGLAWTIDLLAKSNSVTRAEYGDLVSAAVFTATVDAAATDAADTPVPAATTDGDDAEGATVTGELPAATITLTAPPKATADATVEPAASVAPTQQASESTQSALATTGANATPLLVAALALLAAGAGLLWRRFRVTT